MPQAIISLGVKQAFFIKSGFLKAMINVCCKNKIICILYQLQQIAVNAFRRILIPVDINIPAPVSPVFL